MKVTFISFVLIAFLLFTITIKVNADSQKNSVIHTSAQLYRLEVDAGKLPILTA